jgi:hypothetical protein
MADIRFDLGPVVATPDALEALQRNGVEPIQLLLRHVTGDWGNLDAEDTKANEEALKTGARLLSSYELPDGEKVWIITDCEVDSAHHRHATTILLPSNY